MQPPGTLADPLGDPTRSSGPADAQDAGPSAEYLDVVPAGTGLAELGLARFGLPADRASDGSLAGCRAPDGSPATELPANGLPVTEPRPPHTYRLGSYSLGRFLRGSRSMGGRLLCGGRIVGGRLLLGSRLVVGRLLPGGRCVADRLTVGPPEVAGRILAAALLAVVQVAAGLVMVLLRPDRPTPNTVVAAVLLLAGPAVFTITGRPMIRMGGAVAAAGTALAIGHPVGPTLFTPATCLVLAVLAGRQVEAWLVAVAGLVGVLVGSRFGSHPFPLSQALPVAGWGAALLAGAEAVRGRRMSAEAWERARAQTRLRTAGEQRAEVARDLQDDVAHRIHLATSHAAAGLALLDVGGPAAAADARTSLLAIRDFGDGALAGLRSASQVLTAAGDLVPRAVSPGLGALTALARGWAGTGLVVRAAGDAGGLPPAIDQVAYRVVQESLANAARHSCALHVDLALHRDADLLRLVVSDPGPSRSSVPAPGEHEDLDVPHSELDGESEPGPRAEAGSRAEPGSCAEADSGADHDGGPDVDASSCAGAVIDLSADPDGVSELWIDATAGRGLARLRERVEAVGGALSAGPDGAGWSVHVVLPVGPAG